MSPLYQHLLALALGTIIGCFIFILFQVSRLLSWSNRFVRNEFTTGVIAQAVEEALKEDLWQGE